MTAMQLVTESSSREALQLLLAPGLGAIVGLERRLRGHPAGIHTNALVSLGSAAFVIAGLSLGSDVSRVAAQVVTGSLRRRHFASGHRYPRPENRGDAMVYLGIWRTGGGLKCFL